VVSAGTLEQAVNLAAEAAATGEIVLLAPACSSFDQFENYEHRGRAFKELVLARRGKGVWQNA
jgi:UDP-N-acetylmuramoylalanine--D-glutamate ligase